MVWDRGANYSPGPDSADGVRVLRDSSSFLWFDGGSAAASQCTWFSLICQNHYLHSLQPQQYDCARWKIKLYHLVTSADLVHGRSKILVIFIDTP